MEDSPLTLDPQCLGAADVELVEQIFQRIMSDGPQYARLGGGRTLARSKVSSDSNSSNSNSNIYSNQIIVFPKSGTDMKWKDSESHGHHMPSGNRRNSENRFSPRNRSAGPLVKRQIAMDCNLKSLPVHSKMWLSTGEPGRVSQGQIILQPPNGAANPRKGLSGSKVRPVSLTHPVRQTKSSSGPDPASEQSSSVSASASPSPRPYSLKHRSRNSNVLVDEEEEQHGLVSHYRWNASEQGLRLRRQLTRLTSCRSMKRASEMIQHRLDPMYLMNGARLSLQNRYMIDDTEMHRLQEMTQMREGLMSDLKKMKFPYGTRPSQQIIKDGQSRSDVETKAKGKQRSQDLKVSKAPFSTPASEPPLSEENHRALSEHSDSEESLNGPA